MAYRNARLWKLEPWENAVNAINSYIYGFLCYTLGYDVCAWSFDVNSLFPLVSAPTAVFRVYLRLNYVIFHYAILSLT